MRTERRHAGVCERRAVRQRSASRLTARRTGPWWAKQDGKWLTVKMMDTPARSPGAVVPAHQGHATTPASKEVMRLQRQRLQQHGLCRQPRAPLPTGTATSCPAAPPATTGPSPWMAAPRPPSGRACTRWRTLVQVRNPASGFIQNCNSTPFTVAGQQ
ncbi:MAG: hypothetical protein WKG07_41800 [Hymenobacter sp.]